MLLALLSGVRTIAPVRASTRFLPFSTVSSPETEAQFHSAFDAVDGIPESHRHRLVRIFRPSKTAMSSGVAKTHHWAMEWLVNDNRWANPLMGWTSTGDPFSTLRLTFDTAEGAIHYAKRHGWQYKVEEPTDEVVKAKIEPKNYGSNFVPAPPTDPDNL